MSAFVSSLAGGSAAGRTPVVSSTGKPRFRHRMRQARAVYPGEDDITHPAGDKWLGERLEERRCGSTIANSGTKRFAGSEGISSTQRSAGLRPGAEENALREGISPAR